jgi:hypothetical protein
MNGNGNVTSGLHGNPVSGHSYNYSSTLPHLGGHLSSHHFSALHTSGLNGSGIAGNSVLNHQVKNNFYDIIFLLLLKCFCLKRLLGLDSEPGIFWVSVYFSLHNLLNSYLKAFTLNTEEIRSHDTPISADREDMYVH